MAAAASTGIISGAMADPNAATSATAASAAAIGAQPGATAAAPTGSTITGAPTALNAATADPTGSEAAYLNQLNAAATPAPSADNTPSSAADSSSSSTSSSPSATPPADSSASGGIIGSAMSATPAAPSVAPSQKDVAPAATASPVSAPAAPSALSAPAAPATPAAASISSENYAGVTPTAAQESLLTQLYQSDLGRAPDASGASFYANLLNQGVPLSTVESDITSSPEYAADHPATSSGVPTASIPTVASTYTANKLGIPTQLKVSPDQTVQGQLTNIMNPNSAIIMQARTGALQQANADGLLNSSMAITAGDNAAYSAAIPIAEQDAGVYNNAASTNASAANTFAQANQNAANTAGQFNAGAANTLTGQQLSNQTSLTNAQLAAQTSLANTGTTTASSQAIAQLNATNSANMQTQTTLASIGSSYANWLNQIQQSATITDKNSAVTTALQTSVAQYAALGGNATNLLASIGATSTDGATNLTAAQISSGTPFMVAGVTYTMQNGVPIAQNAAPTATSTSGSGTTPPAGAAVGSDYTDPATGTQYIVTANGVGTAIPKVF